MTQPPPQPSPPVGGLRPTPGGYPPPGSPPAGYVPAPGHPYPGYARPPYPGLWPPPPAAPGGRPLASFADRLLAYLIDTAIWSLVAMVLAVPAIGLIYYNFFQDMYPDGLTQPAIEPDPAVLFDAVFVPVILVEAGLIVVLLLLYYVYYVEIMFRSGQTLGKRIMKIRVVPLDPTASLTRGLAFRRYAVQFPAGMVTPGLSLLDGLWQLWDKPYQQCLHDKFARTVVVKVPG